MGVGWEGGRVDRAQIDAAPAAVARRRLLHGINKNNEELNGSGVLFGRCVNGAIVVLSRARSLVGWGRGWGGGGAANNPLQKGEG